MYYHTQEIKYVTYGKIYPPPVETLDQDFLKAYIWLSKYCGYYPQIWLSRSKQSITGYKAKVKSKKRKFFGTRRNFEPNVMFSFDIIKGFPVDFNDWCYLLNTLINLKDPIKDGDNAIQKSLDEMLKDFIDNKYDLDGDPSKLPLDDTLSKWWCSKNLRDFLERFMFVEKDQVVVPSLNLKSAKEVFCRNEKQVKVLRHMGFINDRIKILNSKFWD